MKFKFTLLIIALSSFSCLAQEKPFVIGTIREIYSSILNEKRTLNIYLPEGYKKTDTIKYPVIYLLDGSADEDFIHIAGLVQFANFPWVNLLPPSIVVGISNIDRKRDYTFPTRNKKDKLQNPSSGGSKNFIEFIEKELEPYIDTAIATSSKKTIIGQSLGGLLATEILFTKPQLFDTYIIISPSLWWDDESLLQQSSATLKAIQKTKKSIYIAVGKEGPIMEGDAKKLTAFLKANNHPNIKIHLTTFMKENHATIMHLAVYDAFRFLNLVH